MRSASRLACGASTICRRGTSRRASRLILKQCPHLHDVAGVLGAGSEDAVTRGKWEGVKGHVPGASRVLNEGELIEFAAQQFRRRPVEALDRRVLALLRL